MADLPSNFLLEPMPHEEAVKWIADKPVASRQVFDELLPELKARAFLITGVEDANVVAEIRQLVAELPAGAEWEVQRKAIIAKLGPWFGEGAEGKIAAEARATLLLRVHGFQAYRTYSRAVMERQKDVFPWRQYLTVGDEKVRQSHAAMNDIIAPADSPFWNDKPGGWGCRCREVALSDDEANEARQEDAGKALEDRRVLEGLRLKRAEDGFLMRALRDDSGKLVRPALTPWPVANPDLIAAPQSLRIDPAQLQARYDAVTWGEFRAAAEKNKLGDGRTVWQWLNEGKAAKVGRVPVESKPVRRLADVSKTIADLAAQVKALDAQQLALIANLDGLDWEAKRRAFAEHDALGRQIKDLRDQARETVSIPVTERGVLDLGQVPSLLEEIANRGARLVERYTHADLLPRLTVELLTEDRAFHQNGVIHIDKRTSESTVLHEVTHGTEIQSPDVLQRAVDFLAARAGSEPVKLLRKLTGDERYELDEYAYEDEFFKRGGQHYSGKYYGGYATEILTMGVERLNRDPLEFAANDREYFDFVVGTLQKL